MRTLKQLVNRCALALGMVSALGTAGSALAQTREVTVAYQQIAAPMIVAMSSGTIEKATGYKINWRQFESGAKVATAMASGDVQIGVIGSSPLAAAVRPGLDQHLLWIIDRSEERRGGKECCSQCRDRWWGCQ